MTFESLGTASTSRFDAKTTGFSTSFLAYSWSGSFVFAEAKTSGVTPCWIWAASSSEPAKENFASALANVSP